MAANPVFTSESGISIREPRPHDFPSIMALLTDHQDKYLDDYSVVEPDWIKGMIARGDMLVFDEFGFGIAFASLSDIREDLHLTLHFIARPGYLRRLLKGEWLEKGIDQIFAKYQVGKIKSGVMASQKSHINLLRRMKFRELAPFYKETKVKGVKVDTIPFELKKTYWEKYRLGTT